MGWGDTGTGTRGDGWDKETGIQVGHGDERDTGTGMHGDMGTSGAW